MSVLSLSLPRSIANRVPARKAMIAIAVAIAAVALAAAIAIGLRGSADAATVTIELSPAKEASLVAATTGEAGIQVQAVGDRAKLINAALPFAGGPVRAARPFDVSGSDLEQRRALLCLTQAVYYEAGFEPLEGQRAVAQVVLNRMRHPAFPKSVCGVVYQSNGRVCQFTFVCDGALNRAPAAAAWRRAEAIARAALDGYVAASVGSATHYHADYVAPRWAPLLAKVAQLGQHIFYRWPGAWGQPAAFTGRYIGEPRDPASLRPVIIPAVLEGRPADGALPVVAGPPMPRADNDVGGLLDTTKGWTLNIPMPGESGGAAERLIATQQGGAPAKAAPATVASAAPAVAGR
jgi:hypothetical protein